MFITRIYLYIYCLNNYVIMNIAYLKVTCGLRFHLFFFGFAYCLCLFTGIVVQQLWSSAFSRKHELWAPAADAVAGMVRHLFYLFNYYFFLQLGWCPPPELGAIRKQHTLHIIVHIAQTGPQGHFSVGPQRGRGSSPQDPPPPPSSCVRHWVHP